MLRFSVFPLLLMALTVCGSAAFAKISKSVNPDGYSIKESDGGLFLPDGMYYSLVDDKNNEIAQFYNITTGKEAMEVLAKAKEANHKIRVVTNENGQITGLILGNNSDEEGSTLDRSNLTACQYADDAYSIGLRVKTKCGTAVTSRPVKCIDPSVGLVSFTALCEADGSITAENCVKQAVEVVRPEPQTAAPASGTTAPQNSAGEPVVIKAIKKAIK